MTDHQDQINQLLDKLETLLKRQDDFSREINELRTAINLLKSSAAAPASDKEAIEQERPLTGPDLEIVRENATAAPVNYPLQATKEPARPPAPPLDRPKGKSDLEKFIGENLINKIGIIITVMGVAIGAKYSIENDLISPLTRIILGYLTGLGLLGFGIKLKIKYENFSAVLVSGAMAILYFITYSAYAFYGLFPQIFAFALMVVFTAFTVVAALHYNRQIIAHIGLVGAYAVPFLLSDGSGKVAVLFSYMAIINVGILAIAFKKYWKPLYYASFGLTWTIFFFWYVFEYRVDDHFGLALTFSFIFFVTFYLTFLAYKLLQKEKFKIDNIIMLLANSFIFYGIGYSILQDHKTGEQLLGIFTLCNAIVHFIVSAVIYRQKLADRNLFYLVSGLVLVFITIAVPVQLDGNWVTLLWAGEAALLFWIGRTKNVAVYQSLSYPLMVLAFFSLVHDWTSVYDGYYTEAPESRITPLFNVNFLTSLLFIAAFFFILMVERNLKNASPSVPLKKLPKVISYFIPTILIFVIYYAFRMEIATYWEQLYKDSALTIDSEGLEGTGYYMNYDLNRFKIIWIINYSLFFVSLLAFVNFRKIRDRQLGLINLGLITLVLVVFLTQGLYVISELRDSFLDRSAQQNYHKGVFHIGIRYVSFLFVALALVACYRYRKQDFMQWDFKLAFDLLLHIVVLWIASSELINWLDMARSTQSYKLGLSILWGLYALFLIALGIWKKKKYMRVGAIVLFGATLLKLFFYDISHLDTIAKTIVFVSLGLLLLIISFLYNKYKHIISNEAAH